MVKVIDISYRLGPTIVTTVGKGRPMGLARFKKVSNYSSILSN